ncbi:type I pullulanase [Streptococcus sp. DD13]|uniref:type I pullulanase n=1 Tax=Streptococcus sp. DD13 TaxID=1777881 RepID=UPI000796CAD9|nr:type I pullulanase [Streptococcus sp. DD13]KXT78972.1 Pullulanase [Streptococcus sp. DD13]
MAFRRFTAYLDDLRTISIHLPHHFEHSHLTFTITKKGEKHLGQELQLQHSLEVNQEVIYHLQASEDLDLDTFYEIYDHDRNHTTLEYRSIVRTAAFDQHFFYNGSDLGANYTPEATTFTLWAPISESVLLQIGNETKPLVRKERGIWTLTLSGDYDGQAYHYLHKVNNQWVSVHDPYALSSEANSKRSYVIDKGRFQPVKRARTQVPKQEAVIYEMSVRDFSSDKEAGFKGGPFQALTESPQLNGKKIGFDYLKKLGVSHVQWMPLYDFGSVDEDHPELVYNWGYDPVQYNVPEGSFASNPNDPYARIIELQEAIHFYHQADLSVIMDVVYNHVYDIDTYAFEKIIPGYCYRVDEHHRKTNGTFCGNDMASERLMIRKYIKDSLTIWLDLYGFDGFRFDLMGILDIQTMNQVAQELQKRYPNVYLYGEGWEMATGLESRLLAHQYNAEQLPQIGFFNDLYRDTLKETLVQPQLLQDIHHRQRIEDILTGTIGAALKNGRYQTIQQTVNYIECHDNATFFDYIHLKRPDLTPEDQIHIARLGLQLVLLSQGTAFLHSGQEFFRTKDNLDNTYNCPDTINHLDWSRANLFEKDVTFIQKLIQFRKNHPELTFSSREDIIEKIDFYWLSETLLRYKIQAENETLEIVINFGQEGATYPLETEKTLLVRYPFVGEQIVQENVQLGGQTLLILR